MSTKARAAFICLVFPAFISLFSSSALSSKCLFVSSYHHGYPWADGIEKGIRSTLKNRCEIKQFNMDTRRNKEETFKKNAALKAKQFIEDWEPDVVIASDDNAAKYLVQPYYKDHQIPFVFCGINWSVDEYGFPYSNATGMVEIAPIKPLFKKIELIKGKIKNFYYLGADNLTEKKDFNRFALIAEKQNIKAHSGFVSTMAEWMQMYTKAQQYDVVVIGSTGGIHDWAPEIIKNHVLETTKKISVTNHGWMMPFTTLGLINIPEEQGEWAASVALHILDGAKPHEIPVVTNRKWDIWINEEIIEFCKINLPRHVLEKAKRVYHE